MHGHNFTDHVRKLLIRAREEAARLRHEYVGTEHILLGLVKHGQGVGFEVLGELGVDCDALVRRIDETVKAGAAEQRADRDLPYTSRAKKVLELAMEQSREMSHSYVGTEHILLGLVREGHGIAAQLLLDAGVTDARAQWETLRILTVEGMAPRPAVVPPPSVPRAREREELAWRRLHHSLDVCQRLGTTPSIAIARDVHGSRVTVSFGPDHTLTVEFPPDVDFALREPELPNG